MSYSDCTKSNDQGSIASVKFDPPSPEKTNQNFTATVTGAVKEVVTNGTFEAKAKVLGITVDDIKGQLCSPTTVELPDNYGYIVYNGIDCPLAVGQFDIGLTAYLSSSAPDDKVIVELNTYDQAKNVIVCVELTLKINKENDQIIKTVQ